MSQKRNVAQTVAEDEVLQWVTFQLDRETYGINVFKVREVMRTPAITAAPDMPPSVEGMVSLRGALVPVIDLAKYSGISADTPREIMIVTEYNGHTQGFLVEGVDTILRLDWSKMRVPPEMLTAQTGGLVTAVTELEDNRLVMMMDVEKVLSETTNYDDEVVYRNIKPLNDPKLTVFFADDSIVARKQITRTLEAMNVKYVSSINGRDAWNELEKIAAYAEASGQEITDLVSLVLTDIEMPEMDGYILTKKIKTDPRFAGVPVIMHSSLSGMSNQQLGKSVGDMYEGAMIPGLILTGLYVGYVVLLTLIKPNAAPALPPEARTLRGFKLLTRVITTMVPPLLLIFLVLGTIFLGIATPTEGGAMGAAGALILAIARQRLSWKLLKQAMETTGKLSSFVIFILVGSTVFGLVFRAVNGDLWVEHLLLSLPGGQMGFLIVVNILVFLLAFFLDFFELSFIIVPLLAPVVGAIIGAFLYRKLIGRHLPCECGIDE